MKKIKIDGMILATFLTTLFYSATWPYINKYIISIIPESYIAIQQIVNCVSIIVFSAAWNRVGDKLFRFFPIICIVESLTTIIATSVILITDDVRAYYILDTLFFALITRNIICGYIKLKARRYTTEDSRNSFDNRDNSAAAAATIIGSLIAIYLSLDFHVMIVIATIGNMIDNTMYFFIYGKTVKKAGER
jgi:hypothetical protein